MLTSRLHRIIRLRTQQLDQTRARDRVVESLEVLYIIEIGLLKSGCRQHQVSTLQQAHAAGFLCCIAHSAQLCTSPFGCGMTHRNPAAGQTTNALTG